MLSSNGYQAIMNTRISCSIIRLASSSCLRTLPSQFVHRNAIAPRCFSSLSSRLYASNVKRYTQQHEWIEIDDKNTGTIGITEHAQKLLGDVVFVELPPVDSFVARGEELGAVESVKSASDIFAPLSGQVLEVNEELTSKPSLINKSAESDGWICKLVLSNSENELGSLLTLEQYEAYLEEEHDEEFDEDDEYDEDEDDEDDEGDEGDEDEEEDEGEESEEEDEEPEKPNRRNRR